MLRGLGGGSKAEDECNRNGYKLECKRDLQVSDLTRRGIIIVISVYFFTVLNSELNKFARSFFLLKPQPVSCTVVDCLLMDTSVNWTPIVGPYLH